MGQHIFLNYIKLMNVSYKTIDTYYSDIYYQLYSMFLIAINKSKH